MTGTRKSITPMGKLIKRYERRKATLIERRNDLEAGYAKERGVIDSELTDIGEILGKLKK